MLIITAWYSISPDMTVEGFKKCCISNAVEGTEIFCGMTVKRMGMLGVSVRKIKALTVQMGESGTEW
jgi:hypothetical protein